MWCIVNLPNGTQQAVKWDPKAIGQECLEKVCKALGIVCEMEYFGLEHWTPNQKESRTRQWINLRNRLSCDSSSGIQLMLALRVKFWVPVHFILQESVRNLFYMQAKVDLLEGRLLARDWSNAAKLAALLCQADGIRFNELSLQAKCPIRMRKEQELLKQQQMQQQQQMAHKDRKEKEYVLSFKKRRLSKQKSVEHIEQSATTSTANGATLHAGTTASAYVAAAALAAQSYSLSAPTVAVGSTSGTGSSASASASPSSGNSSSSNSMAAGSCSSISTSPSNTSTKSTHQQQQASSTRALEERLATSPLRIYEDYLVRPSSDYGNELPDDYLYQIVKEHSKLAKLKMTPKSAKYWLLKEIQELSGYGEEIFSGVTTAEHAMRCDIAVGAHGITVCRGDEKHNIPFSAIAAAKSFRRTFKLEYSDDHNDRKELEIKLPKHAIAAGLYRSITERHAFYVCDKVRGVVTNQFTRDLKGTIASMFKEDTELGKRYVFDIQHTCREVHDQARRILHKRDIEITTTQTVAAGSTNSCVDPDDVANYLPMSSSLFVGTAAAAASGGVANGETASATNNSLDLNATSSMAGKLDLAIREKEEREAAIERCVNTRICEAMTCKICMDRAINTMFNPCCHVIACAQCAARCNNCPNCRVKITSVVKIYLPPELRTSLESSGNTKANAEANTSSSGSGDEPTSNTSNQNNSASSISNNTSTSTTTSTSTPLAPTPAATGVAATPKVTTAA